MSTLITGEIKRDHPHIVRGGILTFMGLILSPLTWWNDLVVNIPIAYGVGWLFSQISESLFLPSMIAGYWFTNILGLFLLHKGVATMASKKEIRYGLKDLAKDMAIALAYTTLIVVLVLLGILRLPGNLPNAP